jgi:hypothetical protein
MILEGSGNKSSIITNKASKEFVEKSNFNVAEEIFFNESSEFFQDSNQGSFFSESLENSKFSIPLKLRKYLFHPCLLEYKRFHVLYSFFKFFPSCFIKSKIAYALGLSRSNFPEIGHSKFLRNLPSDDLFLSLSPESLFLESVVHLEIPSFPHILSPPIFSEYGCAALLRYSDICSYNSKVYYVYYFYYNCSLNLIFI